MIYVINVSRDNSLIERLEICSEQPVIIKCNNPLSPNKNYTVEVGNLKAWTYSDGIELSIVKYY